MRRDAHDQEEVAGRRSVASPAALAGEPDPLAVADTGRDVDLQRVCAVRPGQGDRAAAAAMDVLDRELDLGLLIRTRDRTPATPGPATEEPAEQVFEVEVLDTAGAEPDLWTRSAMPSGPGTGSGTLPPATAARSGAAPGARPGFRVDTLGHLAEVRAERVVPAAQLRIGEHVVCLGDLLEALLGTRVLVHIGVVRAGELPVRPLDLILSGGPRYAEHLVEVPPGRHHAPFVATTTAAGRSWWSCSPYPGRTTCSTVPAGTSACGMTATASCLPGSNVVPSSSERRGYPSFSSTRSACSRTARTPAMIAFGSEPACSSARSRLSSTGSHRAATCARSSARCWVASRAARLRRF